MNLCLFTQEDAINSSQYILRGERFEHVIGVLGCGIGDSFTAGVLNMGMGKAVIQSISSHELTCELGGLTLPPAKLPLTLVMALPRPKMLKRILRTIAELGVERLVLLNTWKVEKSYWQTPFLDEHVIRAQFILGLEQAKDTTLPELIIAKRFKPFVEDELPGIIAGSRALVAHPGLGSNCPLGDNIATCLAIGPEGGFTDYEVSKFLDAGFETFNLGQRILRVENAVTACIAKLYN